MKPLLLSSMLVFTCTVTGCDRAPSTPTEIKPAAVQTTTLHFKVSGMVCEACEQAIAETLERLPGVQSVQASHKLGTVDVQTANPSLQADIAAAIAKLNFTVES